MSTAPLTPSLLDAYGQIRRRLQRELDVLTRWIATEQAAGRPVTRARLLRQQRFRDLLTQTATAMNGYAHLVEATTIEQSMVATETARTEAVADIQRALGPMPTGVSMSLNTLPVGAVNDITARLGVGQPLRELLDGFGSDAVTRARETLITGVGMGKGLRAVAREFRQALDVSAVRALTITRTEALKSYRSASLAIYQANSDVVTGWIWTAAKSPRACAACLARDGSEWSLDTMMPAHPNCRCSLRPKTKSWAELGFSGMPDVPQPETGAAWFARQDETTQRKIMTGVAYEAYKRGDVTLQDFIGERHSRVWGRSTYERSMKEIMESRS